jgi:hypothetical protein
MRSCRGGRCRGPTPQRLHFVKSLLPQDDTLNHERVRALRSNWLISRRMAEISHSVSRNFSPPFAFKRVGTSEGKES